MNLRLSKHPWSAHATTSAGASVPRRCGMCASYAGEPTQCAEEIPVTPASAGTEVVGVESVYLCLNPLPCPDHAVVDVCRVGCPGTLEDSSRGSRLTSCH